MSPCPRRGAGSGRWGGRWPGHGPPARPGGYKDRIFANIQYCGIISHFWPHLGAFADLEQCEHDDVLGPDADVDDGIDPAGAHTEVPLTCKIFKPVRILKTI